MPLRKLAVAAVLLAGCCTSFGHQFELSSHGLLKSGRQLAAGQPLLFAQAELPEIDLLPETEKGKEKEELIPRTKKPVDMQVLATKEKNAIGFNFRLINPAELSVLVETGDGKKHGFTMKPASTTYIKDAPQKDAFKKKPTGTVEDIAEFQNHTLVFKGCVNFTYFVRPNFKRYWSRQIDQLISQWERELPDALSKNIRIEFLPDGKSTQVWVDGRYAGSIDGGLKGITISGGSGPEITKAEPFRHVPSKYLALDSSYSARKGIMEGGKLSLPPGLQVISRIPIIVADAKNGIDLGQAKKMRGSEKLECNEHLSRTAFDGMPESIHYSVPQAQYRRVFVLCAAEPTASQVAERKSVEEEEQEPTEDTKPKNPQKTREARQEKSLELIARITRWGRSGRGDAIADTSIKFPQNPKDEIDKRLTKVGTLSYQDNGMNITASLFLAEIELKTGDIMDFVSGEWAKKDPAAPLGSIGPYLDFELWGPAGGPPSAVHVFGMTLEKSPAEFELIQSQPGNVFNGDDPPLATVRVTAKSEGDYTLSWDIRDVAGKVLKTENKKLKLAEGQSEEVPVPLDMPDLGWYGLKFSLSDSEAAPFITHNASFAVLGPDTREASYESPYGIWWFDYTGDIKTVGPLYFKAGLRKTQSQKFSEDEMAPWKVTLNQIPWSFRQEDLDKPEEAQKRVSENIKKLMLRYPHCRSVLLFHESYDNDMPSKLAGADPKYNDEIIAKAEKKVALANMVGKFYRESFPELKIIAGNSGGSIRITNDLLQFGFDRRYADFIGIEAGGQSFIPESISEHNTMAAWATREITRIYGQEIPLTGCYEFTCRRDNLLGPQKQAEYYVRDILICAAYKFQNISPAALYDAGIAYYNTVWGASGVCMRYPLLYPKPAYVAIATATRVLDKARLLQAVPTGSLSVYALEFERERQQKDFAYAMWMPRGEAELVCEFNGEPSLTLVDLYGKTSVLKAIGGKVKVPLSGAASYLISPVKAIKVAVTKRSFKAEQPPDNYSPTNRMDKAEEWEQVPDENLSGIFCKRGTFTMRDVDDPEKGRCIELELNKDDGSTPCLMAEYTAIKLKQAVEVKGEPHTIGVWVKGNSNWGRIFFTIMDAEGRLWSSSGGYNDWPGDLCVNFDSWCFMRFHIDEKRSPVRNLSPGRQWKLCNGLMGYVARPGGASTPKYPVKILGIYVTMYRKAVDPVEMRDVSPVLRFKDIGAYE